MQRQWNVIIYSSDLCLIFHVWDVELFNRKAKIRQMHINMYVFVQIIGKSFERLLKDSQKTNLLSFVTEGITALSETVIQGFPFIHFS